MQMDENEAFCSAMNPTLKPPINATSFIIANDTTGRSSVRTTKNSIFFYRHLMPSRKRAECEDCVVELGSER